tara:strand:- start:185 stop:790 length:606 start_codon:yes stop_codon:yes gene_type:complete
MSIIKGSKGNSSDLMGFSFVIDTTRFKRSMKELENRSSKIMSDAIFEVLKKQIPAAQSQIKSDSPVRQRDMAQKVADSLGVEQGMAGKQKAEVRFGSLPMDSGGVKGSRGGKLAALLEYGAPQFNYPFTFKSINNSATFGGGSGSGGFINTKGGNNTVHPGFKSIDWLSKARDKSVPKIEAAMKTAFEKAWRDITANSNNK